MDSCHVGDKTGNKNNHMQYNHNKNWHILPDAPGKLVHDTEPIKTYISTNSAVYEQFMNIPPKNDCLGGLTQHMSVSADENIRWNVLTSLVPLDLMVGGEY